MIQGYGKGFRAMVEGLRLRDDIQKYKGFRV